MAELIIMPKQGLQMTEGYIAKWLFSEGDPVEAGKPLFEMETDKLTITIDAAVSGTLLKILHPQGDTVPVAEAIAIIGKQGEDIAALMRDAATPGASAREDEPVSREQQAPVQQAGRVFTTPRARLVAAQRQVDISSIVGSGPDGLVIERDIPIKGNTPATPLARKLAETQGVDLSQIAGTGARGKIVADDVRGAAVTPVDNESEYTRVPMSGIRRTTAKRMWQSLTDLAQANHRMSVDMSETMRMREQLKQNGVKVSLNTFVIMSVARALSEFPQINASMDGNDILLHKNVNVGMAVATERGLLVPVIKNADRKNISELSGESARLADAVKNGSATPDDLSGGTFTVTNLGMYDVDSFTAIINAPEAGILAVGKVIKQPVVVDDEITVRPIMQLSLTYDHRIVDGAPAALFLKRVRDILQAPALLL